MDNLIWIFWMNMRKQVLQKFIHLFNSKVFKRFYNKQLEKLTFKYGNSDFSKVCKPGIFHVDRTDFIPQLEKAGEFLTFLRPRRFGKSMIISMLEYYYDIKWKEDFQKIFGHLKVGKKIF